MIAEMLMWWLALPATLTLLLWVAELKLEGQTLGSIPDKVRIAIVLACIVYPVGIAIWINHRWNNKDE